MKPEYINPFVKAASEVLERELSCKVQRGTINLSRSARTSHEVTAFLGVTGDVRGAVLFGLSDRTARAIVGVMLGQEVPELDELAQSGIAELGNCITGVAATYLSKAGFTCNISPPTLVIGAGTMVSTVDLPRLAIPICVPQGEIEIHVALTS